MNFLATMRIIATALPIIVQLVTQVEAAFPVSGAGSAKLEAVKQMLQGCADLADDLSDGKFDQLWPAFQRMIAAIVALKNATGAFKK